MLPDLVRCAAEAAEAERMLRAGEPNAHELLIWRADAAHEAALCAGRVPETVRRFLVRCGAKITRTGDAVLWDNIIVGRAPRLQRDAPPNQADCRGVENG